MEEQVGTFLPKTLAFDFDVSISRNVFAFTRFFFLFNERRRFWFKLILRKL